jgi:hypothetical protein
MQPCPCCGFKVFSQNWRWGSYAICPVCWWEDDPDQLRNPNLRSGANSKCLYQYQQQVIVDLKIPLGVMEIDSDTLSQRFKNNHWNSFCWHSLEKSTIWHRHKKWRPLNDSDRTKEFSDVYWQT